MISKRLFLVVTIAALIRINAPAAVRYVDVNSSSPTPPYTSWATAASVIQDAIDAADPGDVVLVTNGVYQTGGRTLFGPLTNRVAVTKPLTVQSANGPEWTVIAGHQVPGAGVGVNAMRCVALTNGAALIGFTLTNGATSVFPSGSRAGGGVLGGVSTVVVSNCIIGGNLASDAGGGAANCTLNKCTLLNNTARIPSGPATGLGGGAAYECVLNDCIILSNSVVYESNVIGIANGGGARSCVASNCTFINNRAYYGCGGGASGCTLINCTLVGNSCLWGSGGAGWLSRLRNCLITGNTAYVGGGIAGASYATNCTIVGNSASTGSGGFDNFTGTSNAPMSLENCIVFFNSAPVDANYRSNSLLNYCCTTPLPSNGSNNIAVDPMLTGYFHLSALSPCGGAGNSAWSVGSDLDGEPWNTPPSIGCDEYSTNGITGALSAQFTAWLTSMAIGFPVQFTAAIQNNLTGMVWDFGDQTRVTNLLYTTHSWTVPGDYPVVLQVYNDSYPDGLSSTQVVHIVDALTHYVSVNSTNPVKPYLSWETAATNIQDAIDVIITAPRANVLVGDGVYRFGGRTAPLTSLTNRVTIDLPIWVRSVNGAAATVIEGAPVPGTNYGPSAIRCVYLREGATLSGFTLTNGSCSPPYDVGGGVACLSTSETVSNCVIVGNFGGGAFKGTLNYCTLAGNSASGQPGGGAYQSILNDCVIKDNMKDQGSGGGVALSTLNRCFLSSNSAPSGGGAISSTLNNCVLLGNQATVSFGGGSAGGTLSNCTVVGNVAVTFAGGASSGLVRNSIIFYNVAPQSPNYSGSLNYCCTDPLPFSGVGNITNAPGLIDPTGDLRLLPNSPCINSGSITFKPAGTDLTGNPRVVGGAVDIGAYEFQSPTSRLSYAWLQQFGFPIDGSADDTDPDGDNASNWQEWIAGTIPTDSTSFLEMLAPVFSGPNVIVSWKSVGGRTYFVDRSANLAAQPAFLTVKTNISGLAGVTSFTDTNVAGLGPYFYRVGVQP